MIDETDPLLAAEADPADHDAKAVLIHLLLEMGVPAADVQAADEAGTLHLMALEQLVSLDDAEYTVEQVAELAGITTAQIRSYWRALGFPEPRESERVFSETDLEMLASVLPFLDGGAVETEAAVQMARVIGSSLNRIATAQIEVIEREVARKVGVLLGDDPADLDEDGAVRGGGADDQLGLAELSERADRSELGAPGDFDESDEAPIEMMGAAQQAAQLLPVMPKLMEFVWRRHLGAAARRRILRASGEEAFDGVCVGFADLVGFTAQTQLLPDAELAAVVARFENIAYDVVAKHGGRVVKMIGDEVLFVIDGALAGAELALDLAAEYREDDALSDVRVGLASGSVLEREGDVFGPVVNLASRIVSIAYPSSVVVSRDVVEALKDHPEIHCESIRSYYLKDLGKVPLWTIRHEDDDADHALGRGRDGRAAPRRFVIERRAKRQQQAHDLAGEVAPELANAAGEMVLELNGLPGLPGTMFDEPEFVDAATTGELKALSDVVLAADIDNELQVELLAGIEATRRLQALETEAAAKAQEADEEAERKLDEIEQEARRKVEETEREARHRVEQVLNEAEQKARKANEEASRKVKRVAEETERKAERAERDAKREAKRRADRARAERAKAERAKAERDKKR